MTLHDMPALTKSGQVFHCSPAVSSKKASEEKAPSWAEILYNSIAQKNCNRLSDLSPNYVE